MLWNAHSVCGTPRHSPWPCWPWPAWWPVITWDASLLAVASGALKTLLSAGFPAHTRHGKIPVVKAREWCSMFRCRAMLLMVAICGPARLLAAQPKGELCYPQSPRHALVEMITGGEDAFKKHLTLEVQQKLDEMQRNTPPGNMGPVQILQSARAGDNNFETFDAGPVL